MRVILVTFANALELFGPDIIRQRRMAGTAPGHDAVVKVKRLLAPHTDFTLSSATYTNE
jgi:hypothetical protein